jgi:hypothetical protein
MTKIPYRIGTQPTFFRGMLARIPFVTLPDGPFAGTRPLAALTVRDTSDFTIALLYSWAMTGDVITFYQERLINEGFLSSATERLSVLELARLIGYRPLPGVAASAALAFSVVEAAEGDPPVHVLVPRGTAVTSVPSGAGKPQTFETSAPLDARAEWNALLPRLTKPQHLTPGSRGAVLDGIDTGLNAGDALLLLREVLTPDGPLRAWRFLLLRAADSDAEANVTRVDWGQPLGESLLLPDPQIFAMPLTAAFFGADAPDWNTQPFEVKLANTPTGRQPQDYANWPAFAMPPGPFDLDAVYSDILPGSWTVQRRPAALRLDRAANVMNVARTDFTISSQVTRVFPDVTDVVPCDRAVTPARDLHTSTLLPDGRILIAGGRTSDGKAIANAVLYDPNSGTVEAAADMSTARWNHTATLLGDGTLLIAGGENESGPIAAPEIFKPDVPAFVATTGPMISARAAHRATLLVDATVLLTGGTTNGGEVLATAALYQPSTGTFSGPIAMTAKRRDHAVALYGSGTAWSVLVAGGNDGTSALATAENYSVEAGTFTAVAGSMLAARELHTATVVSSTGAILIAGGRSADGVPSTPGAEQYASGSFVAAGTMTPRWSAAATALQNGGILVTGGATATDDAVTTVESFDPSTTTFLARVPLDAPRAGQTATLLPTGEVALACGVDASGVPLDSVSLYDSTAFTFVVTGSLPVASYAAGGSLLENGYLLVSGGFQNLQVTAPVRVSSLYDPATAIFTATGSMSTARAWHTSTLIDGGSVLVTGGFMTPYTADVQQILDMLQNLLVLIGSLSGLIMVIDNDATDAQQQSAAIQNALQNLSLSGCICAAAYYHEGPGNSPCPACGSDLVTPSDGELLPPGRQKRANAHAGPDAAADEILQALNTWTQFPFPVQSADSGDNQNPLWQQYTWSLSAWDFVENSISGPLNQLNNDLQEILNQITGTKGVNALIQQIIALINQIIAAVQQLGAMSLATAEIYDPSTTAFAATNEPMIYIRAVHRASVLQDGRVLITGGMGYLNDGSTSPTWQTLATAELFDPGAGAFVATAGLMASTRSAHTSTLLPNGLVLITGGQSTWYIDATALDAAELFDPGNGQFATIPPMSFARYNHTATLLPDGSVLIAGGMTNSGLTGSAEVWNPRLAIFVRVGDMATPRATQSAELLPDGRVLVAGGYNTENVAESSAEIFDPSTGLFTSAGSMVQGVFSAVSCRLGDGDILIAGGGGQTPSQNVPVVTSQLFVAPAPPAEGDIRRDTIIYANSTRLALAPEPIAAPLFGDTIELQTLERALPAGREMIVSGVPVTVERPFTAAPIDMQTADDVVTLQPGERMRLNGMPELLPEGEVDWRLETIFGVQGSLIAASDAFTLLDVSNTPGSASELVTVSEVRVAGDGARSQFVLDQPLRYVYHRATVEIAGNVVPATNGETVANEILGSGSSAVANQQFTLKSDPVTWVPAPNPRGLASTIGVRVDEVAWSEVPSLLDAGPDSQVFAVSTDLQGHTQVVFGDGENGSRLPTGADDVVATYRTGIGPDGNVAAGSLSILPETIEGMDTVTNPIAASGGTAPQSRNSIRRLAPLALRNVERIVSTGDFAAFALGFAGVAKADAVLARRGGMPVVLVTVAGANGAAIAKGSAMSDATLGALRGAMLGAVAPGVSFELASYKRIAFRTAATLRIDPRFENDLVLAAARGALLAAFSFDSRALGAGVAASSVMSVLNGVAGVVSVDLDTFSDPAAGGPTLVAYIAAHKGRMESGLFVPAQMVVADENAATLVAEESS